MGKAKGLAALYPNLANVFVADRESDRAEPLVLIIAPTPELCCQFFDEPADCAARYLTRLDGCAIAPCWAHGV